MMNQAGNPPPGDGGGEVEAAAAVWAEAVCIKQDTVDLQKCVPGCPREEAFRTQNEPKNA